VVTQNAIKEKFPSLLDSSNNVLTSFITYINTAVVVKPSKLTVVKNAAKETSLSSYKEAA